LEEQRRKEIQGALIGWAVEALGRWAGASDPPARLPDRSAQWLSNYGRILFRDRHPDGKRDKLLSIFSLVEPPKAKTVQQVFVSAHPLSLETILPNGGSRTPTAELWRAFVGEFEQLPEGENRFETFTHLFCKYTWAVPCTYGEEGVSLYEEFKALAALVHASDGAERPAEKFLLVGGDIPGIQGFLYTLTSKGAARGLRGRSFFLQLLGDAVVRALRRKMGRLPETNVIYAAGGNFTLLAPADSDVVLSEWRESFNKALLEEFEGDLYLALAWEELSASAVRGPDFAEVRGRLGAKVATAKGRRFAEVVKEYEWEALFKPKGLGGKDYCQVCQREPRPGEKLNLETTEAGEEVRKCGLCRSFEALAGDIAYDPLWMMVAVADDAARQNPGWRGLLARLTGFAYRFEHDPPRIGDGETACILNHTDLESVHSFRFLANVTPRIGEADRRWAKEHPSDQVLPPGERIKDFGLMARQAEGIQRVGVLRMDVDNLGAIFGQYLRGSMAQTSALSAALDLFFAGHLNRICAAVNDLGEHKNVLYVIYAGGDDLFVVGAWDRMPILAERIRDDFAAYTGHNPHLTISGGVTLEGRKFPLYRAAERAGEAEGRAKGYKRADGRGKDAFCFLGQVVAWGEEWELVREQKDNLLWLVGEDEENRVKKEDERDRRLPRALLQTVRSIHQLYYTGLREARRRARREKRPSPDPRMFLGRWTWMHAYSLARTARRSRDGEVQGRITELQKATLQPETVYLSGLAARWAEYLLRSPETESKRAHTDSRQ